MHNNHYTYACSCSSCYTVNLNSFVVFLIIQQQRLIEVRQWQEKVRNFDKSFITDNGIFFVDCSNIHDYLIPRLSQIIQGILKFVSDEARKLATEFCDEMKEVLEVFIIVIS